MINYRLINQIDHIVRCVCLQQLDASILDEVHRTFTMSNQLDTTTRFLRSHISISHRLSWPVYCIFPVTMYERCHRHCSLNTPVLDFELYERIRSNSITIFPQYIKLIFLSNFLYVLVFSYTVLSAMNVHCGYISKAKLS